MNPSISAAPEPFQVGKRYRTRGGWAAEVKLDDGSNIPLRVVHEVIHATHSEETVWHLRDGRARHSECDYDLLPGTIDEPAESAVTIKFSDEMIREARNAMIGWDCKEDVTTNLRDAAAVFEAEANRQMEADKPPESAGVIVDLMAQVRAAKIRAERAEAAIERAREAIEKELRNSVPGENVIWFHACASHIAAIMGLTIAPARELTVTWNKEIGE